MKIVITNLISLDCKRINHHSNLLCRPLCTTPKKLTTIRTNTYTCTISSSICSIPTNRFYHTSREQRNIHWNKPSSSSTLQLFNIPTKKMCLTTDSTSEEKYAALPSSMTGSPVKSLVPPGQCQFTDEPVAVPLLDKFHITKTSTVLRFGLPQSDKPLQLSTCACILALATIDGELVVRPYTPITTNDSVGYFDLLVKNYGPGAKMSHYLCDNLNVGETTVSFKHIVFNVKTQAPFPYDDIVMVVGGTGITPMVQALHAILGEIDERKNSTSGTEEMVKIPKVTMLYGSRESSDILGHVLLQKWASDHPDHFKCIELLSHEPEDSEWQGRRGFIDEAVLKEFLPSPDATTPFQVFICGPPPMYDFLSGPRTEKEVTGLLGTMGYKSEQVYKF